MARHTPHPPAMGPDFGPGGSSPQRTAPRRGLRALRALGWLLVGSVTLVLGLGAGAWWWAGSETSLATALQRAAQFLPADQQLQARGVTGSLRSGGHIDDLRWSSPGLVVQATDLRLGWQLIPLLQRRLELGELHAAQVQITPLDTPPGRRAPGTAHSAGAAPADRPAFSGGPAGVGWHPRRAGAGPGGRLPVRRAAAPPEHRAGGTGTGPLHRPRHPRCASAHGAEDHGGRHGAHPDARQPSPLADRRPCHAGGHPGHGGGPAAATGKAAPRNGYDRHRPAGRCTGRCGPLGAAAPAIGHGHAARPRSGGPVATGPHHAVAGHPAGRPHARHGRGPCGLGPRPAVAEHPARPLGHCAPAADSAAGPGHL